MVRRSGTRMVMALLVCVMVACALVLAGCPTPRSAVAPDASFEGKPVSGSPPLKVQFTDTSKPGTTPIHSWLWEFGDGTTSAEPNPSHMYYEPGAYTVSLTVTTAINPASKATAPRYVTVTEATTVAAIGPQGGEVVAKGARLVVPPGVFADRVIIGVAAGDGSVPVDVASGERLVSEVFGIAHDQDEVFVGVHAPLRLELPYIAKMVPAAGRNGTKVQILARQDNGVTVPIVGEVEDGRIVAPITGLAQRASYAVLYRPGFIFENIPVDDVVLGVKNPTGFVWAANAWRVGYTQPVLQALTALLEGTFDYQLPYDRRDYSDAQTAGALSDLRNSVREIHTISKLVGFMSPALIPSPNQEFTLILHALNDPPVSDYSRASDVAFSTSIYGSVVVDPAQLIAISKRNAVVQPGEPVGANFDRKQELDLPNGFSHELLRAIFRGYDLPRFAEPSQSDLDADHNPKAIPYYQGFRDGLATLFGQVASAYHAQQTLPSGQLLVMPRSMGFNEYGTFWASLFAPFSNTMPGYSYATQDFFAFVGVRFPEDLPNSIIPKALIFVADPYEGVVELIRERTADPAVDGFENALVASRIAVDQALQKNFDTPLSDVYWEYARDRAYENSEALKVRPTDLARKAFTFNEDRFNAASLVTVPMALANQEVRIDYASNPILREVPPLSTRAIVLESMGVSGNLVLTVNAFSWVPDANGNSMRVKVYKDGLNSDVDREDLDGTDRVELTPQRSRVVFSGFGSAGDDGFERAIVIISNVTADQVYSVSLLATVQGQGPGQLSGGLVGQVRDATTGAALQGVSVEVFEREGGAAGPRIDKQYTGVLGEFIFAQLPAGDVKIVFSRTGYVTQAVDRTIVAGGSPVVLMINLREAK